MAKDGGKLLIKYRDPVAASFSSKDVVMNVQTGTLFYKRNRKLYALRGTPDNFDLVVFPGQSTNQQILFNDSSQDGSPIMEGSDQFRFKPASATCGCANYFDVGAETLTTFSGSVRIGEHLSGSCNLLDDFVDPSLMVYGNLHTTASAAGIGNIHALSGNITADLNLFGTNAYISGSLIHSGNTGTRLTFGTDIIELRTNSNIITTINSSSLTVNSPYDLYIPGTNQVTGHLTSSGTNVLVMDNITGQVYRTGSYGGVTFKSTGLRTGDAEITGSLDISNSITASKAKFTNLSNYPSIVPNFNVLTIKNGTVFITSSAAFNHYNYSLVADNGNVVTSNAQIINFVGNAVTASGTGNHATVTVNAITESLWYDGRPSFLSSSYNILVGNGGNISPSENLKHEIHITSSNQSASIGFTNASSSHWSTGMIQSSGNNIFHISDHGTANTPTGDGITQVLRIFGTGSGDLLSAPEAISIHSGLRTGGATPNPTFIGATDVNIPTIMIDPVDHSTSLAKLHINTMGVDDGMLYNGLCVGPYFNPNAFPNQRTGSGVFIHIGETQVGDTKESEVPKITGKTELGANWGSGQSRGLVITAETDRSVGYPNSSGNNYVFGNATQQSPIMEFKVQDISKQAYSASINNPTSSGINSFNLGGSPLSFIAPVYGTGDEFIIGMEVIPRNTTNRDANYLYTFKNDLMPLLSIEASGKVGIGNFSNNTTGQNAPKAMLDISAKSGSDADILLKTITPNTIPLIKLEVDNYGAQSIAGNSTKLYNPQLHRGEFYMHTDYASGTFYENQKASAVVIESKGKQEGLAGQTYPFNIKGAAKNSFETNNIQFVVGGDNSFDRDSSITSSHAHNNGYPPFSNNNGRAAITIEGISDFRRFGEVGIGLSNPSSSLHVTKSVQADNFRTTNPVDILGSGSIKTVHGSNFITGSGTNFTTNFKVGDAIKITGRQIISTPPYTYHITSSEASASVSSSIAGVKHQQLVNNDVILISSGALHTGIIQTGSYHIVTSNASSSINNTVFDSLINFNPAYTGITTQSNNIIHRINPYYYQIATVDTIHSDTSMSISQNWEGTTDPLAKAYYEEILFQVKTADYRPVFSIAADGTVTNGGIVGTFKSTGLRQGHAQIEGDLTIRPQDTLPAANLNIISKDTGSAAHSILTLKQYDQGNNTTGSKIMYNAGDNEFQILGNKGIDKHLTIHHDSGLVTVKENLIVAGNISANGAINTLSHITASGNISASGLLFVSSSQGNYSNVVVQDTASGRFYTTSSAALTTATIDTFKSSGIRVGDSEITGSLIIRPTGGGNDASLKIIGGGAAADDATLSLRQNLTGAGYALKYDGGVDQFQILGNNEQDIHLSIKNSGGTVRIPGTISSSGTVFHGGLTFGTADSLVTVVAATGEFKRQGIADALANAGVGLVSSSQQIQNYDDFLLNTTDTLTGDLTVTGTITAQEFHTEFVSASIIFQSGSTQFGNSSDDIHTFSGSIHVKDEGHITASGNVSASGYISASHAIFPNLPSGVTNYSVFYDDDTGELKYEFAPSSFTPGGISGSWQGQNFVSASQTFLSTGQRNGDSAITGSFEVTSDITGSKLLIQKSAGPGFDIGISDIAIFQNNAAGKDASISIIAADNRKSQLHFGRSGSIDQGSIKYLHHGNASGPDKMIFKVSGSNIITFSNVSNKGAIGVGGDHNYPTNYFHAQGPLSGTGLMLSSSNGTGITIDRGTNGSLGTLKFNTDQTTDWTLGNINGESDNNFYIYNGASTGDKHISLTPTSTNFLTSISASGNITASGNISASGTLNAGLSQATSTNIAYYDTSTGLFTYELATLASGFTAAGISGSFLGYLSGSGILSSSQQIASDISGSFLGYLSGSGILSSSQQIADDISGSWQGQNFISASQMITIIGSAAFNSAVTGSWYDFSQSLQTTLLGITGSNLLNITNNTVSIDQNLTLIQALQSDGSISASVLDSPAQGQARLTSNGVAGAIVDLGLETTDKPEFQAVTSSILGAAANMFIGADYNNNAGNSSNIFFQTKGITRMALSGSGNVGIGTSNPTHKLEVVGTIRGLNHISASNKIYGGLGTGITANTVFYNPVGGELTYGLAPASFTAAGISGSWEGQNFVSASQTFLSTGQRNGDSAITGSLIVTNLTASKGILIPENEFIIFDSEDTFIKANGGGQESLIIAADRDITLRPDFNVVIQEDLTTWATFNGADRMLDVVGDISASGLLYASSSQGNYSNIVVQDTASGRFYTTASAAIIPDTFKTTGQRSGSSGITGSLVINNPNTGYTVSINDQYGNVSAPSGMGQFNTLQISTAGYFSGGYGSTGVTIAAGGNIQANGNLTVDGITTLGLTTGDRTKIRGHLTASGNISASGDLTATKIIANDTSNGAVIKLFGPAGYGVASLSRIGTGGDEDRGRMILRDGANIKVDIRARESSYINGVNAKLGIGTDTPGEELTVHGNISASGLLYASASSANGNPYQTVMMNTSSGEFFYTGSYGGGGGGGGGGSTFTAIGISGSWQGQNFISASQTFLSTGQRNGDSAITGALEVTTHLTASGIIRAGREGFMGTYNSSQVQGVWSIGVNDSNGTVYKIDTAADDFGNAYGLGYAHNGNGGSISGLGHQFVLVKNGTVGGALSFEGDASLRNITSSGNISASGNILGNSFVKGGGTSTQFLKADGSVDSTAYGDISGVGTLAASGLEGGVTTGQANLSIKWSGNNNFINDTPNGALATFADGDRFAVVDVDQTPDLVKYMTGTVLKTWVQGFTSDNLGTVTSVTAGAGMTQAGTSTVNPTLNVVAGAGLFTTSTDIQLDYDGSPNFINECPNVAGGSSNPDASSLILFSDESGVGKRVRKTTLSNVALSLFNNNIVGSGNFITLNGAQMDFAPGGVAHGVHYNNAASNFTSPTAFFTYNANGGDELRVPGDVIAFFQSDKRLKDNIKPISNPIKKILQIGGYSFDWNKKQNTYSGHDIGVIAQEIEKVLPEVVETRENGYKAVKYEKIVPLLIEGIKDQQKQIDELKELVAKLINK